jgi:hypothetical protein
LICQRPQQKIADVPRETYETQLRFAGARLAIGAGMRMLFRLLLSASLLTFFFAVDVAMFLVVVFYCSYTAK